MLQILLSFKLGLGVGDAGVVEDGGGQVEGPANLQVIAVINLQAININMYYVYHIHIDRSIFHI